MRLLLDTHLLIWTACASPRLSLAAKRMIDDPANEVMFSAASIWEIAIKFQQGKTDFPFDPAVLRTGFLDNGYQELMVSGEHGIAASALPLIHKDPFDRLLLAQATVENILLLTVDPILARYPGPVRAV